MSLIRNGGFESGNTDFWSLLEGNSFVATDTDQKRGTYSGLVLSDGVGNGVIRHNDYIEAPNGSVIKAGIWIKGTAGRTGHLKLIEFDGALNQVTTQSSAVITLSGAWQEIKTDFTVDSQTVYASIQGEYAGVGADEACYFDSCFISVLKSNDLCFDEVEVAYLINQTSGGNTESEPVSMMGYAVYTADIRCSNITGTVATLDVTVCERTKGGQEVVLGTFAQINAIGSERINLLAPVSNTVYIKYVEGGTWTDCDFNVYMAGRR